MRRVVITGLGVLAPNGIGKEAFWDACLKGVSAAETITSFDVSQMTSQIACEVKNFNPDDHGLNDFESSVLDRHAQFAIACSTMAVADADMDVSTLDRERVGVYVGSTNSACVTFETSWEQSTDFGVNPMGTKPLSPHLYAGILSNAAPSGIAMHYGFKGPRAIISDACSSGVNAIDLAR